MLQLVNSKKESRMVQRQTKDDLAMRNSFLHSEKNYKQMKIILL